MEKSIIDVQRVFALCAICKQLNYDTREYQSFENVIKRYLTKDISEDLIKPIFRYLVDNGYIAPNGSGTYCVMKRKGIEFVENLNKLSDKELIFYALGYSKMKNPTGLPVLFDLDIFYGQLGITYTRIDHLKSIMKSKKLMEFGTGGVHANHVSETLTSDEYDSLFNKNVTGNTTTINIDKSFGPISTGNNSSSIQELSQSQIAEKINASPINNNPTPTATPEKYSTLKKIVIGVSISVLGAIIFYLVNKYFGINLKN